MSRWRRTAALTLAALCLSGCDDSADSGIAVTGTVMAEGTALSGAVITLEPARGTRGPNASTPVFDGKFAFLPEAGLVGGQYLVRISLLPAEIRSTLPTEQQRQLPPADAVISPEFDSETTLRCHVRPNETNDFNFAVSYR